jgi:hypothetical protein
VFVKQAISTVLREGGIGILLTGVMILIFLGSFRATVAVFLSIPISVFITFFILHSAGKSIDAMALSGLALAFSRLIDDSVVVIENIYRHLELGEEPAVAAVKGTNEVARCKAQATYPAPVVPGSSQPAQTVRIAQTQLPPPPQDATAQRLTLADAENIAIQNHPQIQAATQLAAAAQVREVQSIYYPQANGAATGTYAENNSRIAAGLLNSPSVFNKFSDGVSVSQLVTDFGRTHQLSKSSHLHAQAQQENVVTTRADVLLRVNLLYFAVMKAQSVLRVAEETVQARQLVSVK